MPLMPKYTIGLVGNPNCGKTTLFNALTGANQRVGNWPGVTVERKEGRYRDGDTEIAVIDLPGVYALDVEEEATGLDECVARDYLLANEADLIVNIVDAANLERNLYLTSQILDIGVPVLIALNMTDLAQRNGITIDAAKLAELLGCPVVALQANRGTGLTQLRAAIRQTLEQDRAVRASVAYPPALHEAIADLAGQIATRAAQHPRWAALTLLQCSEEATSEWATAELRDRAAGLRQDLQAAFGDDLDLAIADARYTWIHSIVEQASQRASVVSRRLTQRLDRIVLNRTLGIPIFLVVMYATFLIAMNLGGAFIDFFDIAFGTIFVDGTAHLLESMQAPGWSIGLLADGVGGGIQTTATFIPQIGLLFICLAILEDSGYMARAAFVMDRLMRFVGLPGKSFVPMMVGFGCNIPGIMAARTLENSRDRLMTVMMNPFMSCGARLPVYALFCAAFFPRHGQNIVFLLYLLGIAAAVFTGVVLKNTVLKGQAAPFVMELPPYHIPTLRGVAIAAWQRLRSFITRAGKMIVIMVVILGLLNSVGTDGSFGKQDSQDSVLSAFSRTITPAFAPMGIEQENWPATVGIFTGVFAKEVMVGTMDALYTELAAKEAAAAGAGDAPEEAGFDLWGGLGAAVASIPANLADLTNQALDPIGLGIMGSTGDLETAATEQEVSYSTFGQMSLRFGSTAAAIAFLLFVLLYFPCVSATAAVYRETNLGWTAFVALWTTGLGYWAAVAYYQLATFRNHPASSLAWLLGLLAAMFAFLAGMKAAGKRQRRQKLAEEQTAFASEGA